MESPLIMRLLASSVTLASRASSIVRNVFASNDLGIVDKGVDDLQSRADRDAQRCIVGSLTQSFPGINIIGEEGKLNNTDFVSISELDTHVLGCMCPAAYKSISLSDLTVWVDPLDGTKEYTEGFIEHVTVLIGIAVSGKPVAGVIAQPFYRGHLITSDGSSPPPSPSQTITRIVWAMDGLGVFGVKPNPPASPVPYPINPKLTAGAAPHVIVVTRSHPTSSLSAVIDACAPTEVLRVGGCGYKVLLLLEGRAHVYLFPSMGTKRWDTCAPEAILNVAGGRLTDMWGKSYDYHAVTDPANRNGILAVPVADWISVYTELIPPAVLDSLSQ
ncbi:hypothetical protein EG68_12012 [Paragonimus skrjabini miyazakii]|uniref:3'(2'),5'-bisphosphate nucleotidase 1 n=1 Tax=Paragonimus skrjabini miyazakii TaxID=59628 RepID=A0A8S9YFS3_9TREM|nr:hypothetical protein EG68_12012 [Paragonimus skrjabini miyazakii]